MGRGKSAFVKQASPVTRHSCCAGGGSREAASSEGGGLSSSASDENQKTEQSNNGYGSPGFERASKQIIEEPEALV